MTDHWKSSLVQHMWKHIWLHGFVIGVGFVLIGFLVWFFITETPLSSTSHLGETAPQVQAPVDPTGPLKSQLAQVLAGIKAANQKNDLAQLLSYYSPTFPQLHQKTQKISKDWKTYDYPKMDFEITEVRLLDDQTAVARVTWDVEAHNISNLKNKNISKTYLTRFARESGQWRIKALDKAE
jgi:hypothetical protein